MTSGRQRIAFGAMVAFFVLAPLVVYPVFLMKVLCFALFACAFNLLIGYGGLLSFGHAMFLGMAGYATAHAAKVWGLTPELAILFGTLSAGRGGAPTPEDQAVARMTQSYWVNFARTGDPNGEGLPAWPRYSADERLRLELLADSLRRLVEAFGQFVDESDDDASR